MAAQGFVWTHRKCIVFVEARALCGIGAVYGDGRRDASNVSSVGPSIGRTDAGCWGPRIAAHELMHNLGGVQLDAPDSSNGFRCVDGWDVMCYIDPPDFPSTRYAPPDSGQDVVLDCNDDSASPPADSYLATHWNTAQNHFLIDAVDQPPLPPPSNDAFTEAIQASAHPCANTQYAISATVADDDPPLSCYGNLPTRSVWYRTTPSTSGALVIDSLGSRYNTVMAIHAGGQGNLTERACNDDADGFF